MSRAAIRLDLQGVRGLGVILVVIGHLFEWPHGVFAALDIFFVLSGFLITGLLVTSLQRHGVGFFPAFYLARFRRLAPMATLVLVVTVLGAYYVFSSARGGLVRTDAVFAFFFAVNWHFAAIGTDYFAIQSASPLLHYWSLSVEEQFYVGWPLLVLIALGIATRRGSKNPMRWLALVLGTVTLLSFGYSLWHSQAEPLAAYFSTFDRAWEFGAGGLLALVSPALVTVRRSALVALSWIGLAGLLSTIFLLDPSVAFPAPWGLMPVLFTLALITGGMDGRTEHQVLLHNPVMVYLGNISYSMYLWHLPLNVLLKPSFASDSSAYYATALGATLVASVLSYHLVERPLRSAPWLMTAPERRAREGRSMFEPRVARALKASSGWLAIGGALLVMYGGLTVVRSLGADDTAQEPTTLSQPATLVATQQERLTESLQGDGFPDFDPSLEELRDTTWQQQEEAYGCVDVTTDNLAQCRFGDADAERTVAVVGDSIGITWMPAIRDAFVPAGWAVQQLTFSQCGTWTLPSYLQRDGSAYPACAAHHQLFQDWILENKPDLVILASSYDQVLNAGRPDIDGTAVEVATDGLAKTLDILAPSGSDITVLAPPPPHAFLVDCVTRNGGPRDCASNPSQNWLDHVAGETAAASAGGAAYVQTEDWFCVSAVCPGFVGTTPVTMDGTHLSQQYSEQLSGLLGGTLLPGGAAGDPAEGGDDDPTATPSASPSG